MRLCLAVNRKLSELNLPFNTIVSCIIRDMDVVVPNGQDRVMAGDCLIMMTTPQNQQEAVKAIVGNEHEN